MLIDEENRPKNEAKAHYELKQIAKLIAKQKGCAIIAEEASGFLDHDMLIKHNKREIVDVGAVKLDQSKVKDLPKIIFYGFEAKASVSDFRKGYNCGGDYNYVIAPKGIVPLDEMQKGVGLYEVDLENYNITHEKIYSGIKCVKRATNKKRKWHYRTRFLKMTAIARQVTNYDLYKNCKIKLGTGIKWQ